MTPLCMTPLDGDKRGSVTGSWDAFDSITAGGTVDSGIGDSLSGAEVFWMGGSWDVFLGSIAVTRGEIINHF